MIAERAKICVDGPAGGFARRVYIFSEAKEGKEGSRCVFLMVSTRGRLLVLGGSPLHGSDALDSQMGACLLGLSLGQLTGDGRSDGKSFWGGLWMVFL